MLLPVRTACAALMALLMLALLSFAQAQVSASITASLGGSGISAARQGDSVALLRVAGKTHAVEARVGPPLPVKLVGGNTGALVPTTDFRSPTHSLPVELAATAPLFAAPPAHTNQPRAPPFA